MFIDLRERERERETSIGCLPHVPQPRIEPTTFWCTGQCSNQLSHPQGLMVSLLKQLGLLHKRIQVKEKILIFEASKEVISDISLC